MQKASISAVALLASCALAVPLASTSTAASVGNAGPAARASVVEVTGSAGDWQLTVDGSPYQVKGLTWGPPMSEAATHLPDVHAMGVNTVRTWGTDGTTLPLLDAAAANDILVINGFWLQPGGGPGSGGCVDYVTDDTYKADMLAEITKWVDTYKEHSGVLMWNVGNESVLGLQNCYEGAELEQQRDAYTTYVNRVAQEIHAIDPNHPVTSTDAWTGAWPYYKANAPDLDLYAVNAYADICGVQQDWIEGEYVKPYIITEAGPPGEWEVPDDANGVPTEPTDVEKRAGYPHAWDCITAHDGVALGGTLFHYGTEDDFGGVWFNLLPGGERRLSYYAVAETYGGQVGANTPPVISTMSVDAADGVPAGDEFTVDVDVADPDGDPIEYDVRFSSKYVDDNGALTPASFTQNGDGLLSVTAPESLGVWKVYVYARDGQGNVGIETRSFRVVPPAVDGDNLAQGSPTTASSFQTFENLVPENATDGDAASRWASDWSDPQWIQVDLGSVTSFDHVQLIWETSYGKSYQIQVSDDGENWTTVYETTNGNGGVDDFDVNGSGRYVRMHGTERGTGWGYSLYEFGIYST